MHRITFILFILIAVNGTCQQLSYKLFTVKDGLPGSIVYHSLQDKNGFMWFATNQGVSRFDGRTFRNYTREDGLPDNEILKLYLDKYNNIWFLSFIGEPAVLYKDSIIRFDNCRGVRSIEEDLIKDSIIFLMVDASGGQSGYYESADQPGHWKFSECNLHPIEQWSDHFTTLRASSPKLNFYFSSGPSPNRGVLLMKGGSSQQQFSFQAKSTGLCLPYSWKYSLCLTPDQQGIVFLTHDSLYYADLHQLRTVLSLHTLHLNSTIDDDIVTLFCESDSVLWLCTRSKGLLLIRNFLSPHRTIQRLFGKSFCTSITRDREDGYWITTYSDGVYYLPNLSFYAVSSYPNLATHSVQCIRALDPQRIAAGFADGSIMVIRRADIRCRIYPQWSGGHNNDRILDIWPFTRHSMLAATDLGIYQLSERGVSRKLTPVTLATKEIFVRPDHTIVFAGSDGIRELNTNRGTQKNILFTRATCVSGAGHDYYWGSQRGLYACRNDSTRYLGEQYPALSSVINHVDIAPDSSVWVSTHQGIVLLKDGRVLQIRKEQGLPSNLCKQISFDGSTAWIATDKGISRLDYRWNNTEFSFSMSTIMEEDGLTANDVNRTVSCGDNIWAATARGISFFSKNYISHPIGHPLINITRIVAGDEIMPVADTVAIDYPRNKLLVELAGISYRSGKQIHYEYRLKELDSNWSSIANNTIEFPALPYGRFVFEARAVDRWGEKSMLPKRILIIHSPPFWKTGWFSLSSYFLIAVLTILCFYAFERWRQQKRRQEYRLKRKMHDLEMMALRAQMNPHFIFNCLTSIQYHILRADIKNANIYLHKFSTLIRQILQHSTASTISLREEIKLLGLYLELEKLRLGERMDYGITLTGNLEQEEFVIPSMIIQPYVENAIKHGVAPLEDRKGMILISIRRSGDYIECSIDDNGPGIKASLRDDPDREPGHNPMGTAITTSRIDTINAIQRTKIQVRVTDKQESGHSGTGTIIYLSFPITNN